MPVMRQSSRATTEGDRAGTRKSGSGEQEVKMAACRIFTMQGQSPDARLARLDNRSSYGS